MGSRNSILRTEIIDDVRLWSKHYLEVPNLHLGGVPACPFAKKAWHDKKVWVSVKSKGSSAFINLVCKFTCVVNCTVRCC